MYVVAIFALALLSPLPFVTPFAYDVQSVAAQTPFGTGETNDTSMPDPIPPDTSPIEPQNEAPPTGTLTSSSNNVNNPAYAKAGDTITVTFTADGTLHYNATATIHGRSAAVSIFENILNASITVLESDADGYANFEINTSNNLGTTSLSETNLIDDAVFVDKHVPVINIHGPHLVYVTQGESYVEPGVSVIDADPNYSDILSDTSSAITTNTVGTYTIVYTALADGAGNVPFTKTRTVSVLGSSLSVEASYVDTETIFLRFDTPAPALYAGSVELTSAITVDGENIISAIVPGQIRSAKTLDTSIPELDFIEPSSLFGQSVASVGDINQDGYVDLIAGIPLHASTTLGGGAITIMHMGENAESILDLFLYDADSPNMPILDKRIIGVAGEPAQASRFGYAVDSVGDVNGDGFTDVVVGAPLRLFNKQSELVGEAYGGVYVMFLGPNGSSILGYAEINHTLPNGPRHVENSQFGHSVINMGDLNGDGITDIAVSAPEADVDGDTRGAAYVIQLGSDGLPIHTLSIEFDSLVSQFSHFVPHYDTMTWSIENMGDLNGDGHTDLMMSTFHNVDINSTAEYPATANNFLHVLHLGPNGESILNITSVPMHSENMPPAAGITKTVNYGETIKKVEDLNGDGYTDLIIGSPDYLDQWITTKGALFVIFLGENGTSAVGHYEITGQTIDDLNLVTEDFKFQNNSRVGTSVSVLGDINSDGALDIIVGTNRFIGVAHDGIKRAHGGLHVMSFAGPNDDTPHVVIKPNNTVASTSNQNSQVVLDPVLGELHLRSLSTSPVTVTTSDSVPPAISRITTITNTTLNIEFTEDITQDTKFEIDSFRVSGTDEHVAITSVSLNGSNAVLLNVTRISSNDEPLVEIFDSTIKDTNGNVIKYAAQTTENTIGSYPLGAFWAYNDNGNSLAPALIILYENVVLTGTRTSYTVDGITANGIGEVIGYEKYHTVRFYSSTRAEPPDPPLTFALNSSGVEIILDPKESFLDVQNDPFSQNYTVDVETIQPPKLLYAETSENRYITLTVNRYVTDVDTTDFSVSDSLSVNNVSVDGNKIILDVTNLPGNSTPTVTIDGVITDSADSTWIGYTTQDIVNGDTITAFDGSSPVITKAEYDNFFDINVSYSEPIDESTIDADDFKMIYIIENSTSAYIDGTTIKKITNIDTASDGTSSVLTFDKKLNPDGFLRMIGMIHDKTGTAMPYHAIFLEDTTSPTMSSAKTTSTTLIEIKFTEDIDSSSVSTSDFDISDNIAVNGVSVLDDVVVLDTSSFLGDATPTITLVGAVSDRIGNQADFGSQITIDAIDTTAPSLTSVSITSDNANNTFAKSGDEITLVLVADEDVSFTSGTILETTPQINPQGNTINVAVDIVDATSNGPPTFTITIEDDVGNTKTVTHSDITGTNVNVDTIAPVINLIGSNDTTLTLGKTYSDAGTIVIDNDPNYAHVSTILTNTINSATLGSYEVTYSAQPDSAGNVPANTIRNVTVTDADPINITSLTIVSSSTDNFANEGKTITVTLGTDGTDLGNFTGTLLGRSFTNTTSGGSATFTTTVLSGDTNGDATFSITVTNSSGNEIVITNNEITDGTSVTIDTVKPVITLTGSSTDTVLQGNSYADQGATVSDLNYPSSTQTVTASPAPLITSTLGDQIITYSAPDDPAGNAPDSIIRTVTVLAKPLNITTLTITSNNNVNTSYAKANDVITLTLVANGTIGSSTTVSIASTTITPTITSTTVTNDTLTASYTVESSLADTTSLAFTITTYNEDNLQTVTSTVADLAGSSIIIDNTAPTITLQGDDPLVFYTSRSSSNTEFVDPGADAYDLSYETLRINATTTPDISVPGTFTLNYEAPDDLAGNTGPTVTRALTVQDAPSISITSLSILTATGNSAYAKAGEGIFLTLTVNDTIVSHNTQILGASPHSATIDTNTLRINAITPNDGTESNATFTITVENAIGATLTVTENDLLGSNVFVDTLSPRIELVGAADYFVIKDTTNPIIPNVTITEHDPNYSNTFTLTTPDGIVDATVNGSVYNYTYTAAADTAGNLGDSVSRTITVIDADPITITSLSIASSPGNPNLANAGKTITVTLETDGTDLGNFTGTLLGRSFTNTTSGGSATFTTTVLSGDTNGDATFSITVTNSSGNRIAITNTDITDSSYVTIDTTKPVITLNGISPDTVLQGNSYTDLGATATDLNNPSYEQLATASAFTTSSLGPQDITYSAPADDAGNTPDSITRTVNVLAKPLGIDALTITSNNANSSYAKANDVITLRLDANGTLGSSTTVSIASNTVQHTLANDILTVSYTVESSLGDTTSLPFIISASNEDNLQTRTFTQANLPGSSIIIDNTVPSITLNGDNNTIVATNSSYTDSGATASDTSYAGDIQITGTGNVDIAQSGSYTVTYTAPADAAGNLAPSIIRIVSVVDLPPIDLTALTITSASSGKYVKAGDTLFLTLTLNDTLVSHNSQILGASITSDSISTNILYLQAVISNDVIESYAEFTVMVTNDDGVTLTVTEDDLSDLGQTNVFIDTVSPSLTLIDGPANYSIVNGTTPIIRNVTAHDGDPNYLETYTLTTNATVDTSVNGSVYNYTYTAVADTAGNLGESIIRIITIIDADPIGVTSLSITSNSGDNFANAGKTITLRLETDSTDLGNFTGTLLGREFTNSTSGGSATFTTTVLSGDTNGNVTFSIQATNSSNGRVAISESDIEDGSYVTIDTVKPVITRNGISPDTVLQGNSYTDLGATATDLNNPSYEQLATASALTTSSIGEKTITYSAPADDAGNTPDSITRTVNVLAKPLGIDALTITSNNANSSYAKANDVITLRLDANGTLGSSTTVSIASNTVQHTLANDILTVSYTVESSLGDTTSLPFIISASNEDNLQTRTFTQANLPGSSIIIDNTAPSITLNGPNNTIVATNNAYTDLGATASDSSYAGDIQVTGTSNVDITQSGNYTVTYTAPADAAGNLAPSIIRIVSVVDLPPIDLTALTITSASSGKYVKAGDTLFLTLTLNDTLVSHNSQILGASITSDSISTNILYLQAVISNDVIESYAEFNIAVTNDDGVTLTVTEDDLSDLGQTNVFIDTVSPRLTLIDGPANYSIINGTVNPIIRNVTAYDGDPNYLETYTLTTNAIVDASVNGSVYNYTYTAVADTAGNLGESISRIITIIDALPIDVTSLSITSSPGNPNFAKADDTITLVLRTDSNDLGNITGTLLGREFTNSTSGGSATFTTTVLSGDTNGNVTFSIEALNSSDGRVAISESDITDGSFVTIDTILPVITLNGINNTIVAVGADYTDPGAAITDPNNPSYAGTITANPATVDTSSSGNKTITYTAPADAAGNVPDSITRIVAVEDAPPIEITLFTITSNNNNNSYAKAGDTLTIQSSINYTIASFTATIFGIEQSVQTQNSNGFLISQQVPYDLAIEENATFSITIVDEKGLPNTITENTLITSSQLPPDNIFIDTISPTITKLLPESITFEANADLSNITTTVNDGAPNYVTSITIDPSTIVNTSIPGVYPFTYSAPDDAAGNPGQSATINFIVKDDDGSTVLNSSIVDDTPQSFSNSESIKAEIHDNNVNASNTLELSSPIVELDVSGITTSVGTTTHTTTYRHPLDLIVNNGISAQIESGTVLTFTADPSDKDNFIVKYLPDDGHNDDAIQLGLENVSYALTNDAIAITFERVSSSPTVYLRDNANDPYMNISLYSGIVTDGASAYTIIKATNSIYDSAGALYTHDTTMRTVTLWTTHLSTAKENSTSSSGGGDESDSNSPTLGKASSGAQLVTNGFEYNGLTVNVGRYHTEFPLIGTNVGDINTIKMKVYDSAGPTGVKRVEFALGVPDIGLYHEAEAFVEVWMQRDSVAVQETIIVDELNLLENSDVSATVSQTSCSGDAQQCLLVELQYSYREPPAYNTISIKPVDWDNNAHQFYFNDGIHVDGDSINLPKEITISASHAADTTHAGETLHLVQIDRAEHLWVDQYGYQWKIIGNTVRQITVPEYLVPDDNTYGTLHGPDRNHPEFASSVYAEQQKAQETLAEILGHTTIMKPLPESGGTIYFDATGTDSRSGDSFKLLLELETARMHQLSNLLYDDTS